MPDPGPSRWLRLALVVGTFLVLGAVAWVLGAVFRAVTAAPPTTSADGPAAPATPTTPVPPDAPRPVVLAPVPDEVLRVGGEVSRPEKISGREPRYNEIARRARIQGVVILEAIIERDGRVSATRVLKPLPFGLDKAAQDAVAEWRFRPALRGDTPVRVVFPLVVEFRAE